MKLNILIVEDHELTRFGLKTTFEGVDYVESIFEAESAEKALEIFDANEIDVIIMDLGLPGMNGIEATQKIRSRKKDVKVIMLTSHNDEKEVISSLKAGANAYVLKASCQAQVQDDNSADNAKKYDLTARESQILKLMTEGYSNMEIAQILVISINTTKAHVANILQKLEVDDRLQAALKALKNKIV